MTTTEVTPRSVVTLWDGPAGLHLRCGPNEPAALVGGDLARGDLRAGVQPLVEVLAVGYGRMSANLRTTATAIGARLRPVEVRQDRVGGWLVVEVVQVDVVSQIAATTTLRVLEGNRSMQVWTRVRNIDSEPVHLQAVTSLAISSPLGDRGAGDVNTIEGYGDWLGESRWTSTPLRGQDGLVHLDLPSHQRQDARGARAVTSRGTWSSGERTPSGVLAGRDGAAAIAWQIEHNGAWRAEMTERLGPDDAGSLGLVLQGPTDADHAWMRTLRAGEEFTTVPVSVAAAEGSWAAAVGALTRHRRALRRPAQSGPFVVFNDYMNTLMGDPTTAKLLPLIDAAASVGAEVFCIDAGWYDDGGDWWDSVGEWEPSVTRFPDGGLHRVIRHIRERGMVPGLWLEPEVVGVRSPTADRLPADAFLQRSGRRIVEHDRYLLDLRHDAAHKHLDSVVDRLVDRFGVGYFKLDYNVTPGSGTDLDADSVGDGLLRHNRGHLEWLDGVQRRHPTLMIENCASGGMRADFALLSRLDLQSTSDQQNPLLYPPIAVGALASILPEQAANWAYPQPAMTPEQMIFTLTTGLAGRLYLSGQLDGMSPDQLALVAEGVTLASAWRDRLVVSVPVFPLGLPRWDDCWLASGLDSGDEVLVSVWFRGGSQREVSLDLPPGRVEVVFPRDEPGAPWQLSRRPDGSLLVRVTGDQPQARVLRLVPASPR